MEVRYKPKKGWDSGNFDLWQASVQFHSVAGPTSAMNTDTSRHTLPPVSPVFCIPEKAEIVGSSGDGMHDSGSAAWAPLIVIYSRKIDTTNLI